ncbi:MAG: helix-turn-helix transcriptional regulator [Candidatus Aenigmatarchaeota archaeon]
MNGKDRKKFFRRFLSVVLIIVGFVIAVSFFYYYLHQNYMDPSACACTLPINWILAILTSLGVLVGMATYYYLSGAFKEEKEELSEEARETLKFLGNDERKIVEELIDEDGAMQQSRIVKETGVDKVKVSRKLSKLEDRGIISKEDSGMSNLIRLKEPFVDLYVGS